MAKDDFGLGHQGHNGMYNYMTAAFGASAWVEEQLKIAECNDFADFLSNKGIMLNYNERVGNAFSAMHRIMTC